MPREEPQHTCTFKLSLGYSSAITFPSPRPQNRNLLFFFFKSFPRSFLIVIFSHIVSLCALGADSNIQTPADARTHSTLDEVRAPLQPPFRPMEPCTFNALLCDRMQVR